jgi:hypothetical protein
MRPPWRERSATTRNPRGTSQRCSSSGNPACMGEHLLFLETLNPVWIQSTRLSGWTPLLGSSGRPFLDGVDAPSWMEWTSLLGSSRFWDRQDLGGRKAALRGPLWALNFAAPSRLPRDVGVGGELGHHHSMCAAHP